ncbi:MAG: TraB/GumN family protein [Novosphingobium sp.]|nr:TraB/GumN family protein [Novosphingobium sp.]
MLILIRDLLRHLAPRRLAAVLMALLFPFVVTASAREPAPSSAPASAPAAVQAAYPALWKVSDADTTIYLFGTIHALPKGIEWFGGPVAKAFEGSQELVTEIVESDPAQMQKLVMEKAMLPQGQTLRAILPPETRVTYEGALGTLGVGAGAFDAFEPWYAAIGLATLPLVRQGYDNANGVETALDAKAKALGRPHSALETAEFQLSLFDSLPLDVQKRYLAEVVTNLPHASDDLAAMVDAWRKGDADRLASLMNADEDDPALVEALLINRNRAWAGWVRDRLAKPGTVFVAVGAGHLAGPGSVQDQLARLGIASTRVQ